jgi:hypothetical protein
MDTHLATILAAAAAGIATGVGVLMKESVSKGPRALWSWISRRQRSRNSVEADPDDVATPGLSAASSQFGTVINTDVGAVIQGNQNQISLGPPDVAEPTTTQRKKGRR